MQNGKFLSQAFPPNLHSSIPVYNLTLETNSPHVKFSSWALAVQADYKIFSSYNLIVETS